MYMSICSFGVNEFHGTLINITLRLIVILPSTDYHVCNPIKDTILLHNGSFSHLSKYFSLIWCHNSDHIYVEQRRRWLQWQQIRKCKDNKNWVQTLWFICCNYTQLLNPSARWVCQVVVYYVGARTDCNTAMMMDAMKILQKSMTIFFVFIY